jgi:sugar phosphate isomerase/epimerase
MVGMNGSLTPRLGILASCIGGDLHDIPRTARQLGFAGMLLDVWSTRLSLPELSASGRRDLRRIMAGQDQQIIGLTMDLGPKGLGPGADVDLQIARLDRAMDAAAGLQAPLVCVDLGPLPPAQRVEKPRPSIKPQDAGLIIIPGTDEPPPAPAPPPAPIDSALVSQVNNALVEIGARADRYSVMLAFSASLASFAALSEALAGARCPWFGVDLDPVAVLRDEWDRDAIFSAAGPLIRHVRARDAVVSPEKRTKPAVIGRGDTKWSQLLALLDEAGYSGFLTLDTLELPDRAAAAASGAKYLRDIAP